MQVKVFCLPFNGTISGFDDSELRSFLKDKDVIGVAEHFFLRNEVPYLTMTVKYQGFVETVPQHKIDASSKADDSWKELLTEADMGLFNILREWRYKKAKNAGLPPYVIFTNRQLAQIVKKRPQSATELSEIEGVGKAKVEKHGDEILAFVVFKQNDLVVPEIRNELI